MLKSDASCKLSQRLVLCQDDRKSAIGKSSKANSASSQEGVGDLMHGLQDIDKCGNVKIDKAAHTNCVLLTYSQSAHRPV